MQKRKALRTVIIILAVAMIAVVAVIVWKRSEYSRSAAFYEGLRGLVRGGIRI